MSQFNVYDIDDDFLDAANDLQEARSIITTYAQESGDPIVRFSAGQDDCVLQAHTQSGETYRVRRED